MAPSEALNRFRMGGTGKGEKPSFTLHKSSTASSSSKSHRSGPSSKSMRKGKDEAIFVDSDEDMEEVTIQAGPSSRRAGRPSSVKREEDNGTGYTDDFEAKEAIRVALTKLDSEVSNCTLI